jgi:hypothetical protein
MATSLCCPASKKRFNRDLPEPNSGLASCYGSYDQKRLCAFRDRAWQRSFPRFVRVIFFASEKSDKRPPFSRNLIANRATQHRIARFERSQQRPNRQCTLNIKLDFPIHARERA